MTKLDDPGPEPDLTEVLYGGDHAIGLMQEAIGIGGVRMLRALGCTCAPLWTA